MNNFYVSLVSLTALSGDEEVSRGPSVTKPRMSGHVQCSVNWKSSLCGLWKHMGSLSKATLENCSTQSFIESCDLSKLSIFNAIFMHFQCIDSISDCIAFLFSRCAALRPAVLISGGARDSQM